MIEGIDKWQRNPLVSEVEPVVDCEEIADYLLVLGSLDAAGAVVDSAGGFEERRGFFEEGPLGGGEVVWTSGR